jgi:hypothetical protein
MMNIKKFFEEKRNKKILCTIGTIIAVLVIFQAGVFVGFHKAAYSYGWGERYYKTFGERGERGHRGMMDFGPMGRGLSNSHGTIGKIISIALPTIIIEDQDRIEKTVLLTDDTMLRSFRDEIRAADLKVGDSVVIIGAPNEQAQIEARLIRIMPMSPVGAPTVDFTGTTTAP